LSIKKLCRYNIHIRYIYIYYPSWNFFFFFILLTKYLLVKVLFHYPGFHRFISLFFFHSTSRIMQLLVAAAAAATNTTYSFLHISPTINTNIYVTKIPTHPLPQPTFTLHRLTFSCRRTANISLARPPPLRYPPHNHLSFHFNITHLSLLLISNHPQQKKKKENSCLERGLLTSPTPNFTKKTFVYSPTPIIIPTNHKVYIYIHNFFFSQYSALLYFA
jgi:hypothetical protein